VYIDFNFLSRTVAPDCKVYFRFPNKDYFFRTIYRGVRNLINAQMLMGEGRMARVDSDVVNVEMLNKMVDK
jgi:hypothetical protein